MGVQDVIAKVLTSAEKLKASGAPNEANTKAILVEPMLAALGWDPSDLDHVTREVKVFEGTYLDYALRWKGAPKVYVEAKGISESLDEKKFIAQTLNYANNDGVVWCVLTNGVRYRVFKTNETAPMDQKLLFELDLGDPSESHGEKAKLLRLISREAIASGELDQFGDRMFTDGRVRKALALIAADPPLSVVEAIAEHVGHPPVPSEALRNSLARIFDLPVATQHSESHTPISGSHPAPGPPTPPKGQEFELAHHLANKSALITEIFNEVNSTAMALGADVSRRIRKHYFGYFRGKKSFACVELQKQRVLVYLALNPQATQPWDAQVMRDVSNIGHFGMGDVEYSLRNDDQLEIVKALIQTAYGAGG